MKGAEGKPQLSSRRRNWAPGNLKDFFQRCSVPGPVEGNLGVLIFRTHCGVCLVRMHHQALGKGLLAMVLVVILGVTSTSCLQWGTSAFQLALHQTQAPVESL